MQFVVNYEDHESLLRKVIKELGIRELYDTAFHMIEEIARSGGYNMDEFAELIHESVWGESTSIRLIALFANGFHVSWRDLEYTKFRLEDAKRIFETEHKLNEIVNGKGENA